MQDAAANDDSERVAKQAQAILEDGKDLAPDEAFSDDQKTCIHEIIDLAHVPTHELFVDFPKGETFEDIAIRMIAHADSGLLRYGSESKVVQRSNFMRSNSTIHNDKGVINISPLLLAMQQYFEKYEGHVFW